ERAARARADLGTRLASAGAHLGILRLEAAQRLRIERLDLAARESGPASDVELAQARVGARHEAERASEDLRGLARALQIAAQKAIGALLRERARNRFGLRDAARGERRIRLPLPALLRVPDRLGVADQHELRGRGCERTIDRSAQRTKRD